MLGIVDYGMGNLHSVCKALERLGQRYMVSERPEELEKADGLILPGVGSFKDAMAILSETGLQEFLNREVQEGKLLLGICLGMQLLFSESEENGPVEGLNFLSGRAARFPGILPDGQRYKVPHMGWNHLRFCQPDHPLFRNLEEDYVYFVHSYVVHADNPDDVLAASDYFSEVPAVVGRKNVLGMQFHPEKSSSLGMALLQNYCLLVESVVRK